MTILELAQGHFSDLTGMTWADAVQMFRQQDEAFRAKYPATAYHYQPWHEREVQNGATAPWGFEWYIEQDGLLRLHSANYDSSG